MSSLNKTYRRAVTSFLVMALCALFIMIVGSTLAYFKMGAEDIGIHVDNISKEQFHTPLINWQKDKLKHPRKINKYLRKDIVDAYLDCWNKMNDYLKTGNVEGLSDFFTEDYLSQISEMDFLNSIEQIDLTHNIELRHFSLDNQFVAFTDFEVRLKKFIKNHESGEIIFSDDQLVDVEVIMTQDEGRWRIRQFYFKNVRPYKFTNKRLDIKADFMKHTQGINYYSASFPWMEFWDNYDPETTAVDLDLIKSLNLSMVRIFIPFEIFGKANVSREMLSKLNDFLEAAHQRDLKIIVTMFDFPIGYELIKWSQYDRHLDKVLTSIKDHPAIIGLSLKNEPDLDFVHQGKELTLEWLNFITERARAYAPNLPLTIGWSKASQAHFLSEKLDFVSFHYYQESNLFINEYEQLKAKVEDKPIILEEFGMPSRKLLNLVDQSKYQASYIEEIVADCESNKIPWLIWTLHDFETIPSEVFGHKPWVKAKQKHFGLFDSEGNPKPVLNVIKK